MSDSDHSTYGFSQHIHSSSDIPSTQVADKFCWKMWKVTRNLQRPTNQTQWYTVSYAWTFTRWNSFIILWNQWNEFLKDFRITYFPFNYSENLEEEIVKPTQMTTESSNTYIKDSQTLIWWQGRKYEEKEGGWLYRNLLPVPPTSTTKILSGRRHIF